MSRYTLFLFSLLLIFGDVSAATRDPGSYFFDQSLGNFSDELELAKDEGKKGILIMFEMDECPFCHRIKTRVLNQVEVQDYIVPGRKLIFSENPYCRTWLYRASLSIQALFFPATASKMIIIS
ncbi:MAG: thioredoxin fold domain-containing protein [Candidatus Thiodiazotropha sp. (ex Lucinoma aequizonata)]|nr:thioredoxin fold domain-containing protein [Candidatus Thiodiazotropha sp. (ex Lucinoma aequizonata)]MCU7888515.1 thioredoxin fold domain-containing protein [Candidatus Thiodiazotropha sp. (ex Lucinoma aequizonata)]MCU7893707.1 thioredoxin fold domain-containing protein [Candidatus Thiodiazotropha sp. (ex Lucinoma aequizonata)]MCU7898735.1 thioredoxin fold domain-containing protein [Candidatus Thiodiazotropha sp. (ex Lucinoma aequizonata)]MCU7903281.1 thioredoxin fold domain-containing prote